MTAFTSQLGPVALITGLAVLGAGSYGYFVPSCRMYLPVISHGRGSSGAVALTFDDGPTPIGTGPILDVLARLRVPAAFFVIGENASRYPDLVRRMDAEGHVVCNHTYDHLKLGALRSASFWREQLLRTDDAIEKIIGKRPALFRPPFGHKSPRMRQPLRESGHLTVGWSRRGLDGVPTTPEKIVKRLAPRAAPGDILLLHDGRERWSRRDPAPTIAALQPLISGVRAKGLRFERLDRLINCEAYLPTRTTSEAGGKGIAAEAESIS
jgi:peptidoglycan/xylan/chitin deacetylase (PgdA/CDA1 family)